MVGHLVSHRKEQGGGYLPLWQGCLLYAYLIVIFTREDFRTNQILLVGIVALLIYNLLWQERQPFPFLIAPQFRKLPFLLAIGGSVLFLLNERFLDVNTLSASLFGLATYGLATGLSSRLAFYWRIIVWEAYADLYWLSHAHFYGVFGATWLIGNWGGECGR